jgi:hypothetical protein
VWRAHASVLMLAKIEKPGGTVHKIMLPPHTVVGRNLDVVRQGIRGPEEDQDVSVTRQSRGAPQ